ncbi:unnamed protein product [Urochloa decumbens]|uniref:Uncharacterized protein n=1 Tax=Urochloa decumbens TaxID=240449 RepID=A0ABC9ANJ7_9POAL
MGNSSSSSSAAAAAAALAGCSKSTILAVPDTETGSHVLTVDGYTMTGGRGIGNSINSGTFTVGDHNWHIGYYPDGSRSYHKKQWISVFVYHDGPAGTNDNGGSVMAHFELSLLKPNGKPVSTYRKTSSREPCGDHRVADACRAASGPPPAYGELFKAHRAVLATRSMVFMAELFGNMKEKAASCVKIDDIVPNAFRAMLHFIYTDSLPKIGDGDMMAMAQHLLVAADKYNLERLKLICEDKLCTYIDSKTVVNTLLLADQHGCKCLEEECLSFVKSRGNFKSVMASDDFELLIRSYPSLVKDLLAKFAN